MVPLAIIMSNGMFVAFISFLCVVAFILGCIWMSSNRDNTSEDGKDEKKVSAKIVDIDIDREMHEEIEYSWKKN